MSKKIRLLILGQTGTLGSDLIIYNNYFNLFEIETIEVHRWPTIEYIKLIKDHNCNVLINCVSVNLNQIDEFDSIYYNLPKFLATLKEKKIINFSSDILNDSISMVDKANMYKYYEAKKKTEDLINEKNFINVRTSFIGLTKRLTNYIYRLYNFSLSNTIIEGITNNYWSGLTTLQIYFSINQIINFIGKGEGTIHLNSNCISNFDLQRMLVSIFNFKIDIRRTESKKKLSRCGESHLPFPSLEDQLKELHSFCNYINYSFE